MKGSSTILIPTYERPKDLFKLIHYCARNFDLSLVRFIVLDGSKEFNEDMNKTCEQFNIEYRHYPPSISYLERVLDGLNSVKSDTVSILGDDDIVHPNGFYESVNFLNEHKDYAIAHGKYVGFNLDKTGLKFNQCYVSPSFEQNNSLERLFAYFSSYTAPSYYAVNRTELLKISFQELILNETEDLKDYISAEILVSSIPLLFGKLKRLNSFYSARKFIPADSNKYVIYARYILDEGFSSRYNKIKRSILKHMNEDIDDETISQAIDYTFAAYYGQRITTNELVARFNALNIGK